MLDAAIEAGEQRCGFIGDDGGFEVGAGEGADGFKSAPGGFDDDFDFVFQVTSGNVGSEVARNLSEFRKDVSGKVFEIFGQLRFCGTGGPAA